MHIPNNIAIYISTSRYSVCGTFRPDNADAVNVWGLCCASKVHRWVFPILWLDYEAILLNLILFLLPSNQIICYILILSSKFNIRTMIQCSVSKYSQLLTFSCFLIGKYYVHSYWKKPTYIRIEDKCIKPNTKKSVKYGQFDIVQPISSIIPLHLPYTPTEVFMNFCINNDHYLMANSNHIILLYALYFWWEVLMNRLIQCK